MDKITIDGITFSEKMLTELKRWYDNKNETEPENFVYNIGFCKDLLIRLMCDDVNAKQREQITEALSLLLIMQDSLTELIPTR